ncbi:MAG TPA: SGNH/GDSL hydrolase family protein [Ruminococcus flavefaciens]|nr:SGNH/GDSL hydrolase family protein [Ruminococcus flavefaciens]
MPVYVIDTLKPKNGLDFPVVEAVDVAVEGYSSLADAVTHFATDTAIVAINTALSDKADASDIASLQTQINQIITPVTQDAEVQNARIGADGTSYQTLKARLDAENAAIKDSLSSLYTDGYNLYNIENELEDTIVYSDRKGVETNSSYNSSNWVEDIEPSTTYTITNCRRVQYLTSAASGRTFISAENGTSGESLTFTTPATCECIIFSYPKDATNVMLLKGTEIKDYIPYGAKILSDDVIMPEVQSACVGADGSVYSSLKNRIDAIEPTAQQLLAMNSGVTADTVEDVSQLKTDLYDMYTDSYNLYNIENELENTVVFVNKKGVETNSSYNSSNWVEDIEPSTTYTITNCRRVQYLTSAASGRTFISAENGTSGESLTFTTPATCECIIFSYPKDATNVMLLKGTEIKDYIPYGAKILSDDVIMPEVQSACVGADGTSYQTLKARLDAENAAIKDSLSSLYTDSYNLYNIENELENTIVFVNKKGVEKNSGYNSSDWVEGIKPNTTYTITDCRRIQFLTDVASGRLFISSQEGTNGQPLTFTTPSTCACIAFSYQKSATNVMLLEGSEVKEYVPYGAKMLSDEVIIPEKEAVISNDWLSGKTIAVFGDSIMYGDGNSKASVGELLAAKYGMTLHKYAQSGATIGIRSDHPTGRYHIPNQVTEAIEDEISPDIIIFNGGTNDENGETPVAELGTIPDDYAMPVTESSFSDGFQSLAYQIKDNWKDAIVIYMRAHNMSSRTYQRQVAYGERGIEMCKKWGFGVVDMFKIMNTQLAYYQTEYLADTTHPNGKGYKKYYMPELERYLHENNPNDFIYT